MRFPKELLENIENKVDRKRELLKIQCVLQEKLTDLYDELIAIQIEMKELDKI